MKKYILITFLAAILCQSILFAETEPNKVKPYDLSDLGAVEVKEPNGQSLEGVSRAEWQSDPIVEPAYASDANKPASSSPTGNNDNLSDITKLKKSADAGDANSQAELGSCYYFGKGVEQDYKEAVKWYRKAAEQGNVIAQSCLGVMYDSGCGGVKPDYKEAVKWYSKAAEQGNAIAQWRLGAMYNNGWGVEQDGKEAVKWYCKAAEQGNAEAQSNLGIAYAQGKGVEQDEKEAVKWYRKAAEQGYALAQYGLGCCYKFGQGVEQDYKEAVKWYRPAAEQGFYGAQSILGQMYYRTRC